MFGFFKRSEPKVLHIEGIDAAIEVGNKETLLTAALRQGIRFPHSCRVGGCATCKCRLLEGKVKELTESAYVVGSGTGPGLYIGLSVLAENPGTHCTG